MTYKEFDIPSEKLLITGVTGYIGFKTLTTAVERGQLEFAVVPDFLRDAALDEALKGITAVVHLASPLAIESDDYEAAILQPAISMVTVVLAAAVKISTIRRVVLTSSCVTLIPFEWNMNPDSETLYTVDSLNENPTGPFGSAMEAYWASKALARIAARDFVFHKKPVNDILQGTRASVLAPALTGSLNSSFPYVAVPVHVANVTRAHIDAVNDRVIPGNTEYILSSNTPEGVVWDRDIRDIARKHFPKEVESHDLPMQGSLATIKWRLDGMRTEETFGWKFTNFEETMRQLIAQYLSIMSYESSGENGMEQGKDYSTKQAGGYASYVLRRSYLEYWSCASLKAWSF